MTRLTDKNVTVRVRESPYVINMLMVTRADWKMPLAVGIPHVSIKMGKIKNVWIENTTYLDTETLRIDGTKSPH